MSELETLLPFILDKLSKEIMKNLHIFVFTLSLATTSYARMVTLVATNDAAHYYATNEIQVAQNEIAELVSYPSAPGFNPSGTGQDSRLQITQGSIMYTAYAHEVNVTAGPLVFVGPATVRLIVSGSAGSRGICTWRIEPESFPPDKTIIIPEGTGARIALECSTNLMHWTEVYSETHTNSPSNKFFRIKAERLQ